MFGLTTRVFFPAVLITSIVTLTLFGFTLTGRSSLPWLSTGISGTSRATDRPCGAIVTSATEATTYFDTESGPDTFTVSGTFWTGPSWKPSGVTPVSTRTGTVYVVYGSSWTLTERGSKSITMNRGSAEVTVTVW